VGFRKTEAEGDFDLRRNSNKRLKKKLHRDELHGLSPNIIRFIKLRKMRWAEQV
jgi:hypothetical protein